MFKSFIVFCVSKILQGGEKDMVAVYCLLIMKGLRDYSSVPENLKTAVSDNLAAMELGLDGQPL